MDPEGHFVGSAYVNSARLGICCESFRRKLLVGGAICPSWKMMLREFVNGVGMTSHIWNGKWWTSSVGMMKFPIYGKIKLMFQTTNQIWICAVLHLLLVIGFNQWSTDDEKKLVPGNPRTWVRPMFVFVFFPLAKTQPQKTTASFSYVSYIYIHIYYP